MRLRIAVVAFAALGGVALISTAASAMPNGIPNTNEIVGQTSKYPAGALGERPEGPSRVAWWSATLRGYGSATLRRCGSAQRVASGSGMAQRPRLGRTARLAAASVA